MTKESNNKEVVVFTAQNQNLAVMLIEKLKEYKIPARLGEESDAAGVFGIPAGSRTILVPEKFAKEAEEILYVR